MQIYLVGGAVRDQLLGVHFTEKDWVVVNSNTTEMRSLGYQQVGKHFPIFILPSSGEEYALARQSNNRHDKNPVTLEQDLSRRDLTINAIAQDGLGNIIDPCDGRQDIKDRYLRHINDSFHDDPIRILRVARFMARYHHLGFKVADETIDIMRSMANTGALTKLPAERVWKEVNRALSEKTPSLFVKTLKQCGALKIFFPEIDALYGVPQTAKYHPEIDCGIHLELALDRGAHLGLDSISMYALLLHDLGKGITADHILPSHRGHEAAGVPLVECFNKRIKAPTKHARMAKLVCLWHLHCHKALELKPKTLVKLFDALGIWRQAACLNQFTLVCQADSQGRTGMSERPYPQASYLKECAQAALQVSYEDIINDDLSGSDIGDAIRRKRIAAIKHHLKN